MPTPDKRNELRAGTDGRTTHDVGGLDFGPIDMHEHARGRAARGRSAQSGPRRWGDVLGQRTRRASQGAELDPSVADKNSTNRGAREQAGEHRRSGARRAESGDVVMWHRCMACGVKSQVTERGASC